MAIPKVAFTVQLTVDQYERIQGYAADKRITRTELVRTAIEEYIANHP